jgi:NodT family efflux transporter outer membrane factor (OMF) lipoprotein
MKYRRPGIVGVLLLAGCTVGPDYKVPPGTPMTVAYKEAPPASYKSTAVWNVAQPSDGELRGKWWEMYGDPRLNALEEQVIAANQTLKIAEAHFRQARQLVLVNRAAQFPTLSTGLTVNSVGESSNRPFVITPQPATGDFVLPLDLSYEVDLWGNIRRTVTAAGEEAQATAADLGTAALSLQAELAVDYFELRAADLQKVILDDNVKTFAAALQLTQNRYNGGDAPESDVTQAETELQTTQAQDTDITLQRAQFEHAIATLIGQPPAAFSLPPLPLPWDLVPPVIPAGLPSQLLERRPDIAAFERRMAEANEQIGIAQAAYYPQVTLSGLAGFEGSSVSSWFNWSSLFWAVGLSMTETLFDAGRRHAVSAAAVASYDATVAGYRQTTLTAFQQVEDNLAALRILEEESSQQHAAVLSAEKSLRIITDRYVGGVGTYLEVIIAQQSLLANQRSDADLLRRRMDASVLLIKALGGGWQAKDLPAMAALRRGPLF